MNEFDYLAEAQDKMNAEKYIDVISLCDKALNINENLSDAYSFRANAKLELGEYNNALDDFNELIKRYPNEAEHYYDRCFVYYQMDRFEDAIIDINKAIELEPKTALYQYEKGRLEYELKRYNEAIADLTNAIALEPFEESYMYRGYCYQHLEKYDLALADYNSASEIEPESCTPYFQKGIVYRILDSIQESEKNYKKAIELNPKHDIALRELGFIRIQLGKKDALTYLNKAIKANPSAENYMFRVNARTNILKREKCIKNFSIGKFTKYDTADYVIFNEKQAKYDIKDLNKALSLSPDDKLGLRLRAMAYNYLKQYDKALTDYEYLIELDPNNQTHYLAYAKIKNTMGKYQDVIDSCNTFIRLNENKIDTDVFLLRGEAEYKLKQYEKVIDDTTVVISFEDSFGGYYYRGLAHYKCGHFRQAISDIRKAIEIKSDVLETYDDKLPKLLSFAVGVNKGAGVNKKDKTKPQKSKTQRPIGLAGMRRDK